MQDELKELVVNKNGPVIVIEDDVDDQEFLTEIFLKLNYRNKIMFFSDGQEALDYLNTSNVLPFLILSDINMPKLNGFALREKLKTDLKLSNKCIPYLFFLYGSKSIISHRCLQSVCAGFLCKAELND